MDLLPGSVRLSSHRPSEQLVSVVIPVRHSPTSNASEWLSCKTRLTRKRRHQLGPISDVDSDNSADEDYVDGASSSVEVDIEPHLSRRPLKGPRPNSVHRIPRQTHDPQRVSPTMTTSH